ncbi:MAG: succinylglutamate desuccinylase/aspartoacylase family protein [Phycisphaerales bacterium]|nr:succinylglutamate desuccinylase/aspartoacylase family protein [Phycisphaerales bacterium]
MNRLNLRIRPLQWSCLILLLLSSQVVFGGIRTTGTLAAGTPFETSWYHYQSDEPGPCVLITGGIHGDEPAGYLAARQIADWTVKRGMLIVVPRCNPPAIKVRKRRVPGLEGAEGDLNRHFPPPGEAEVVTDEQAARIWAFLRKHEPDVLLDLHEGYGFRAAGSKSVGSSVITHRRNDNAQQAVMLHAVNQEITAEDRVFVPLYSAVKGSLVRAAAEQLEVDAHILETTTKDQSVSTRTRQHRRMVAAMLDDLGMSDESTEWLVRPDHSEMKIALYDGKGSSSAVQSRRFEGVLENSRVVRVGAADIHEGCLDQFDAVIFPGGSGSGQGRTIGPEGREAVREFVDEGGAYVGVCAGAYLALNNYDWGLKLIGLDSFDRAHWRRGKGMVRIELTSEGQSVLGRNEQELEIKFAQGPLMVPSETGSHPTPEVLAWYRTGIGKNGADPETMVDTPAIVAAPFGEGRVVLFSPHPEQTSGLHDLLVTALGWATTESEVVPEKDNSENAQDLLPVTEGADGDVD